jgi:uncharacterized protein
MTDDVLDTMIGGLLRHRFPQSVFAWQGGEPTLAGIEFYRKAVSLEQRHGASGQAVSNAIQTNGLLIDEEWCRLWLDYHFLVGLSIDGPQDIHDQMRRGPTGHGTWERTMAGARLMASAGVAFNILCVVNAHNVSMGADLARWFVRQGFEFLQFIPCMEPGMPHNVPPAAFGDFLCDAFDYWAREGIGRISIRDFDALLATHMGMPDVLCTFGKKCNNYIVIEHNGDVYPCDFFVRDDWKLGNILDAPLESFLDTEKYRQFSAQKQKVPACAGCPWRAYCYGGCQKDRLCAGGVAKPSPFCAAYKKFFAHAAPQLNALARKARKLQGAR